MADSQFSLAGKKVVILGGSSGLGLATAKAAAAENAQVVIVSSNQVRVDAALQMLPSDTQGFIIDLSNEQSIKEFFDQIGSFDHLVYTAGEPISLGMIADTDIAQARTYFTIRFWGAFASVKYAAPHINPGGSICLTSGTAAHRPGKGWSLGSSICSATEGFTRAMAVELAPIRVNAVAPGVVRTNLWSGLPADVRENLYQQVGNSLLVNRIGEADELAQTYIYLMKQLFVTGQIHIVDGGTVLV